MSQLPDYLPFLRYKALTSQSWTTTGNTHTVTDGDVKANSLIVIMNTAAYVGKWHIAVSNGSFTITSSDVETATSTTFVYLVL
mgnify:CR=1 FL=1